MRLLDAPIRKQAADLTDQQKRDMLVKVLAGAGGGAGIGALTQYLLTGKAGLMGAGLGAAGGAAVGAGLDENARAKIKEFFTGGEKPPVQPAAAPAAATVSAPVTKTEGRPGTAQVAETSGELTPERQEAAYKELWTSIRENPEEYKDVPQEEVNQLRDYVMMNDLQKSAPNILNSIDNATENIQWGIGEYVNGFFDKHGRTPTDKEIAPVVELVGKGRLRPDRMNLYLEGKPYQSLEEDNPAAELIGMSDQIAYPFVRGKAGEAGAAMLQEPALQGLKHAGTAVKEGVAGGVKGAANPATRQALKESAKKIIPELGEQLSTKAGDWAVELMRLRELDKSQSILKSLKEVGKWGGAKGLGGLKGTWNVAKGALGPKALAANVIFDAPTLWVDPDTGEWNSEWWENAKHHDTGMTMREQERTPLPTWLNYGPLPGLGLLPEEARRQLSNMALGAGVGLWSPWKAYMTAGARIHDKNKIIEDIQKEKGDWAAQDAQRAWRNTFLTLGMGGDPTKISPDSDRMMKIRAAYQHAIDKKYKDPNLGEFRIVDRYDPAAFATNIRAGWQPVQLPEDAEGPADASGRKWGWYNPKTGAAKGQAFTRTKTGQIDPTDPYGKREQLFRLLGSDIASKVFSSGMYRQAPLTNQELIDVKGIPWHQTWRQQGMTGGPL